MVVKRLYAQPIAGNEQRLMRAVPDGKGKHSAQVLDAVFPIFFVQVNDGFRVAVSAITMATRDQLLTQDRVVVNLAIENDPDRSIFIADGLVPGCDIDDAEPSHAQADTSSSKSAFIVRTAMSHHIAHPTQAGYIDTLVSPEIKNTCNSTHRPISPFRTTRQLPGK